MLDGRPSISVILCSGVLSANDGDDRKDGLGGCLRVLVVGAETSRTVGDG